MADADNTLTFNSIEALVYFLNHVDKDDDSVQINIRVETTKGSETDGDN